MIGIIIVATLIIGLVVAAVILTIARIRAQRSLMKALNEFDQSLDTQAESLSLINMQTQPVRMPCQHSHRPTCDLHGHKYR